MDDLLRCEARYRDHYARVAGSDRDGWQRRRPTVRVVRQPRARAALVQHLIALAARLVPTVQERQTIA